MMQLASQYDGLTEEFLKYAHIHNNRSRAAFYCRLPRDLAGKNVLDVGCGDGYDLSVLVCRGANVFGIDSSIVMLEKAKHKISDAKLTLGVAEDLPYEDETFDLTMSKYVLQTTSHLPAAMDEIVRVTKTGGTILYLAVHPMRQFLEKKKHPKDYFIQEIVESTFFDGAVTALEPSHTLEEYINSNFLERCWVSDFHEAHDFPGAEQIDGDNYPCFFIVKARKMR